MNYKIKSNLFTGAQGFIASLMICTLTTSQAFALDLRGSVGLETDRICALSENGQSGTSAQAQCAAAKMSRTTKTIETSKTVIFTFAAGIAYVAAIEEKNPFGGEAAPALCKALGYGAGGAALALDITDGILTKDAMGTVTKLTTTIMGGLGASQGAAWLFSGAIKAAASADSAVQAAGGVMTQNGQVVANQTQQSKKDAKATCFPIAVGLTVQSLISGTSALAAKNSEELANQTAANTTDVQKTSIAFTTGSGGTGAPNNTANNSAPANTSTSDKATCTSSMTAMDCAKTDPTVMAMTAAPGFMNAVQQATGQPLAQLVNGFNGETQADATQYAASALGLNPSALSTLMNNGAKAAKDTGKFDAYTPMAYTRAPAKASSAGDLDFGKMMGDMLKNLNPEEAKKAGEDPSELAFRQMELLPPEKLATNKDISLFARIGFRYRKSMNKVEQLNWSKAENQEATRSIASDAAKK